MATAEFDDRSKLNAAAVEMAGRNWLTAQLLTRGIGVAIPAVDHGIDLIVFREVGDAGIRALPLQLKCAKQESFGLHRKYEGRGIPLVYIWHVLEQPIAYFLDYAEAREALGSATETASWRRGAYTFNRISPALQTRLNPYRDRWSWLMSRIAAQPTSGG